MYRFCCRITELSSISALWATKGRLITTSNSQADLRAGQILHLFEKAENPICHLLSKVSKEFIQKPRIVEMPFTEESNGMEVKLLTIFATVIIGFANQSGG